MRHNSKPIAKSNTISVIKGIGIFFSCFGTYRNAANKTHLFIPYGTFFSFIRIHLEKKNWQNFKSIRQYVIKKIQKLYLPYVGFNIVFCLLNNLFLDIGFYTTDVSLGEARGSVSTYMDPLSKLLAVGKILLFAGGTHLGGAFWFFRALFFADIFYVIIRYIVEKVVFRKSVHMLISSGLVISILAIGYYLNIKSIPLIYNIPAIFSVTILLHIGNLSNEYNIFRFFRSYFTSPFLKLVGLATVGALLMILNRFETINIGSNHYNHPITYLAASVVGSLGICLLSYLIITHFKKTAMVLVSVSEYNIWIIALHFVGMRIGNYLIVLLGNAPISMIAAHPIISSNYWPVYSILGMGFPILVRKGLKGIYEFLTKRIL